MSEASLGLLRGLTTVLAMLAFIAVVVWAWSRRQRGRFDAAAQLPLEEDHLAGPSVPHSRGSDRLPPRPES
jgi:cytochrome c oxidase cbb3-type subunit 4